MNQFPYSEIFAKVEKRLLEVGSEKLDVAKIQEKLDRFKTFADRRLSDDEYFSILVLVTFYSGFKASTVTERRAVIQRHFPGWRIAASYTEGQIGAVIADQAMIKHEQKIRACVKNARTFASLIAEYGSIKNYIDAHKPTESLENLLLLKESLEATFEYLGGITVYHFMTDIGLPVLKPDRVMTRIFLRLGLLETERQLLKTVIQGRKFAEATEKPIRYIDIVFVAYGQDSSIEYGIEKGVCLTNPRCDACSIRAHCRYEA